MYYQMNHQNMAAVQLTDLSKEETKQKLINAIDSVYYAQ